MSTIDRKRIAAVAALESLGFVFDGGRWRAPAATAAQLINAIPEMTDAGAFARSSDPLAEEEADRRLIAAAEAYERELAQGKVIGGAD